MSKSLIRDYRDADGQAVQPYFAAYMIECGFCTVGEAMAEHGGDYMRWNGARWREFATPRKIADHMRASYAEDFTDWLEQRALDHAARNHIETA